VCTGTDLAEQLRGVLGDLPELPSGMAPGLKRLLSSRQIEQRLFALRMLRNAGGAELARTCLKLLDHDDERLRKAAIEALANNKQAIEPALKLMLVTRNPRLANACAQTLLRQAPNLTPKLVRAMAEKAIKLLVANPTMGDLLLDLTLQSGGAKMATFYVDRAVRLRRAKRFPEALHVLAKVASTPHGGDEAHYQIALTKIVSGGAAIAEEAAPGNSTLPDRARARWLPVVRAHAARVLPQARDAAQRRPALRELRRRRTALRCRRVAAPRGAHEGARW
jgi:hypothetical protein